MRSIFSLVVFLTISCTLSVSGQQPINPENITIVRDSFGAPFIMAPTDEEVGYGLAWVQCEDQFTIVQQNIMLVRERLGREYGRQGAAGDFFSGLFQLDKLIEERKATDVSPEFMAYAKAFCQGVNDFAERHPGEVLDKKLFPVRPEDILEAYPLKIANFIGATRAISQILYGDTYDRDLGEEEDFFTKGSNAFAFQSHMTKDGHTYLIANPHLSFSGPESFYEVGLMSEEGWTFQGAMFPGSLSPQVGTNKNLGWTHTVNVYDHTDVYALKMHPTEPLLYEYDGEWRKLEKRKIKLKVKLKWLPFNVPVKRTVYESVYGPTLESSSGNFFAIRTAPVSTIQIAEQWYHMTKAQNLSEFKEALALDGLPFFNIVYADKADNILYVFNGYFPDRTPGYDYSGLLPGHTAKTNWQGIIPLAERPVIENPDCGYVYNVNHSPFKCSCRESWLDADKYPAEVGYDMVDDNSRSYQWREIYQDGTPVSMEELKTLKYDSRIAETSSLGIILDRLRGVTDSSVDSVMLQTLRNWNGVVDANRVAPTYMLLSLLYLGDMTQYEGMDEAPEAVFAEALTKTKAHLLEYFKTLEVPFETFFRFQRGKKDLPVYGFPGTLAARRGGLSTENGRYYNTGGDGFMLFVEYDEQGVVEMESVVAYGASSEPDSPYFNSQMELFAAKKAKKMTFDKEKIIEKASRVYHPF